jgi:hypothetical protein
MTIDRMTLKPLLEKAPMIDLLREMIGFVAASRRVRWTIW